MTPLAAIGLVCVLAAAQAPSGRDVAVKDVIAAVTLVKAIDGSAVIRLASSALEKIQVGDRIGINKALVKEITQGRLVLEETLTGKNGKPERALIVFAEGERGGTRYLGNPDQPRITGTRPVASEPVPSAKPAPKKPQQM